MHARPGDLIVSDAGDEGYLVIGVCHSHDFQTGSIDFKLLTLWSRFGCGVKKISLPREFCCSDDQAYKRIPL